MNMNRALLAAGLFAASLGAAAQTTYVIDFGESGAPNICSSTVGTFISCTNGSPIHQGYGDIPGVVDVSYVDVNSPPSSLTWWPNGYNNLYGVAYASGGDGASRARIDLDAGPGYQLRLTHLDLGAWLNSQLGTHLRIWDLADTAGAPLYSFDGAVGIQPGNLATPFSFSLLSNAGFRIEWFNSAYNVGIDHLTFDAISAIPEPDTYALIVAGLALLGFTARRRAAR